MFRKIMKVRRAFVGGGGGLDISELSKICASQVKAQRMILASIANKSTASGA